MASPTSASELCVFHGGDYSNEVAQQILAEGATRGRAVSLHTLDGFEAWAIASRLANAAGHATALLIVTTIENEEPDAMSDACLRFLRRKSHGDSVLAGLRFTVLGLGDSNNLAVAWRRVNWTTPREVNQAGENVDAFLKHLGGARFHTHGAADERTDFVQIEPWVAQMWKSLDAQEATPVAEAATTTQAVASAAAVETGPVTGAQPAPGAFLPESVRQAIYGELTPEEKAQTYQQSLSSWRGSDGYIQR